MRLEANTGRQAETIYGSFSHQILPGQLTHPALRNTLCLSLAPHLRGVTGKTSPANSFLREKQEQTVSVQSQKLSNIRARGFSRTSGKPPLPFIPCYKETGLRVPSVGVCSDYLEISAYLENGRGSTIFLLQACPPSPTQEQMEKVGREGLTFCTEHRVLDCFLLNSFRLGWDEEKQEKREVIETGNTGRGILNNIPKNRVKIKVSELEKERQSQTLPGIFFF